MTTTEIRSLCDHLDDKFGKDAKHICIIVNNKDVVEAIEYENKLAAQNSDITHDVIARLQNVELLYDYRDEVMDIIYNYMEEQE